MKIAQFIGCLNLKKKKCLLYSIIINIFPFQKITEMTNTIYVLAQSAGVAFLMLSDVPWFGGST